MGTFRFYKSHPGFDKQVSEKVMDGASLFLFAKIEAERKQLAQRQVYRVVSVWTKCVSRSLQG
jgi:hypothetical protein